MGLFHRNGGLVGRSYNRSLAISTFDWEKTTLNNFLCMEKLLENIASIWEKKISRNFRLSSR